MAGHLDLAEHYKSMDTDELVRLAADRDKLTIEAADALGHELRERHLDDPDAIRKYEHERDRKVEQAENVVAARRWSTRLGMHKVIEPLRQRPLLASLISIFCPVMALAAFGLLHINSHLLLLLLFLGVAFGAKCGLMAVRSSSPRLIRFLGLVGAIVGVPLALIFLVYAVVGVG